MNFSSLQVRHPGRARNSRPILTFCRAAGPAAPDKDRIFPGIQDTASNFSIHFNMTFTSHRLAATKNLNWSKY